MSDKPIYVTRPSLPSLSEFIPYLEKIWDSGILTNNGPTHQEFEKRLSEFLGVPFVSLFANGTLALITALQVLRVTGEVITTPYSFVATSHSLLWNNITPVFVDVEPSFRNLDPERIEAAITTKTTAILPVHVYGNPCDVDGIQSIADIYGLKVIYDSAHAFAVDYRGQSLCAHGDLSVLSFHATKVFTTMEGGAIVCHDETTKKRIDYLKNFGFAGETTVMAAGINSKLNEMQAALGLLQLKHHAENSSKRAQIASLYRERLSGLTGVSMLPIPAHTESNFAYFPIFIDEQAYGVSRDALYERLKQHGVFGRRYFYPLISQFPMYKHLPSSPPQNLPVATRAASQVICLPIFPDLRTDQVQLITSVIRQSVG